ncbi:MAG: RHS repeat-associated core domain-containing protein [Byssovorax sp.]
MEGPHSFGTPAWTYELFYEKSPATGYSLLQEVRRCGALGGCLPAKQFGWHSTEGPVFEESTLGLDVDDGLDAMVLDADGDGMDEVVSRDNGGQLYLRRTVHPKEPLAERTPMVSTFGRNSRPVDIDGDGAFEIVGDLQDAYRVYRWEPENHTFSLGGPVLTPITTKNGVQNPLALLDLDGDGLADLVTGYPFLCSSKTGRCWDFTYEHNDGGTFGEPQPLTHSPDINPDPWTGAFWTLALDPFGEHRAALFYYNDASDLMPGLDGVMLDTKGDVARVVFPPASAPNAQDFPSSYADMNGDGLRDYLSLRKGVEKGQSRLCVYFTTGGQTQLSYLPAPTASPLFDAELSSCLDLGAAGIARMLVADLDADGKEDVLLARGNLLTLVRLGADRKLHPTPLDVPFKRAQIGDFDGNGLLDIASWTGIPFFLVERGTAETADRLVAVTDEGDGVPREKVTYTAERFAPPGDPSSCAHPLRCPRQAFTVASRHDVREGQGYESVLYRYEAPRFDVHGRGFLGFGTVRSWEPGRAAETVTTYDNVTSDGGRYPHAFRPATAQRAVAIQGKSGLARVVRTTYEDKTEHLHGDKTWFAHPSAVTTLEWEEEVTVDASEGAKVHISGIDGTDEHNALRVRHGTSTYDGYGNPLEVTASTVHGNTEKTVTTYEVREDDWLIALPKTVTASSGTTASHLAYDYDLRGYLCRAYVEKDDIDPDVPMVTSYAHDQEGLVRAVTLSAAGVSARTTHIAYGGPDRVFPSERWNDLGHAQWMVYDQAFGAVIDAEDMNGKHTRTRLDDLGRPLSVEPEGGAAAAFSYEPRISETGALAGFRVVATSDTGAVSRSEYDARGRIVRQSGLGFDGTFIESSVTYDALGRVSMRSRPGFGAPASSGATYTYDNLDRVTKEVQPGGAEVLFTHSFFETHEADPMLHARAILRDVDDRVVESTEIIDGKKLTTKVDYGDFDRVLAVTDPLGNQVVAAYDRRGRRAALSDPDAGTTFTFYNGLGDTRAEVKNGASFTTYAVDVLGRVVQIEDDDGVRSFAWDKGPHGIGRLSHRASPNGIVEDFGYDDFGRPVEQSLTVDGETLSFGQGYDALGRPNELRYPAVPGKAPLKIGRAYGQNGQLARVFEVGGTDPLWKAEARNEDGQLLQASLGNGLLVKRAYEEETGRLSAVDEGAALSVTYDYTFDGQVHHKRDLLANRVETYDYDALHRLTRWTLSTVLPGAPGFPEQTPTLHDTVYSYDDLGNLTDVVRDQMVVEKNTYGEDGRPHTLTSNSKGSFVYDDRGRQKKAPDRTVIFAEHDRPKSVFTAEGETHFTYDAMGNRVRKTGPGGTVLTFGGLYERRTIAGKTQHIFTVEGGEGAALQIIEDGGPRKTEYLHRDPLGSIGAISDKNGTVGPRRYYEPFGALRDQDGAPLTPVDPSLPLGFTGHHNDGDLGLIDMKGRVYDPSTRRFLTPDPHVSSPFSGQAYNRYSYAANDPINLSDPTGFDAWSGESGCIGLECIGGGGWDGTILGDSQWIENGVNWEWHSVPSFSAGMSSPKRWTMGAVLAIEGQRAVGMPVGPTAAGSTRGGPNASPHGAKMSAGRMAERIAIKTLQGFGNAWFGFGKMTVLNAVTFGGYSTFSMLSSMWDGYKSDGVLGAFNGINPLYHLGKMGADAYLAMGAGNYEKVAEIGGNVLGMASIVAVTGRAGAAEGGEAEAMAASANPELPLWAKGQPTRGWLDTGRAQIELWSGESGGPAALPMPGRNNTNFFHVEAHAAQTMRVEGISDATLYINKVPCGVGPGCANNLPYMLPEGAQLRVIGPEGYDQTFVGLPDPPTYP